MNTKKPGGNRQLRVRVKTAKSRSLSSSKWLERQLNDPYVNLARQDGYRSRAAFKLIQLNEKFQFLRKGTRVVDLGAAPGGWTQVAVAKVGKGNVVAIDCMPMQEIEGAHIIIKDFLDNDAIELVESHLNGKVDVVMSDMAAPSCGHPATDHIRIMALCEAAFEFSLRSLNEDGTFVAKVLRGGTENHLLNKIKKHFKVVKNYKPDASRSDSAESYLVAKGFRQYTSLQ